MLVRASVRVARGERLRDAAADAQRVGVRHQREHARRILRLHASDHLHREVLAELLEQRRGAVRRHLRVDLGEARDAVALGLLLLLEVSFDHEAHGAHLFEDAQRFAFQLRRGELSGLDLAFAFYDKPHRYRLYTSGRESAFHLSP